MEKSRERNKKQKKALDEHMKLQLTYMCKRELEREKKISRLFQVKGRLMCILKVLAHHDTM